MAEGFDGPCVSCRVPVSLARPANQPLESHLHASVPLFPADLARDAERGGDRVAPADAARRHDAAGGGGGLCLPSPWPARAPPGLPPCTPGAQTAPPSRNPDGGDPTG